MGTRRELIMRLGTYKVLRDISYIRLKSSSNRCSRLREEVVIRYKQVQVLLQIRYK